MTLWGLDACAKVVASSLRRRRYAATGRYPGGRLWASEGPVRTPQYALDCDELGERAAMAMHRKALTEQGVSQ